MNAARLKRFQEADYKRKSYNELTARERKHFKATNAEFWQWIAKDSYKNNEEGC